MLLPEPPKKRGRKPFPRDPVTGEIIRPPMKQGAADGVGSVTHAAGDVGADVRPLPAEPDALMKAIAPYGVMAKPGVIAVSHVLEVVGSTPLNKDEESSLTTAGSAFLYQYFPQFDSRVMLVMAIFGIALPRLAIAVKEMREAKKKEKEGATVADIQEARKAV